jgi:aminoglycoside phosphotransferase (APT) family kinase protein
MDDPDNHLHASHLVPDDLVASLQRMGLVGEGEEPRGVPLAGGVSSDIWRIDLASGPVCVKRALGKLKVAADWQVPVERNLYEVRWFQTAGRIAPDAVPKLLGHDPESGAFAMAWLPPEHFRLWKAELHAGRVDMQAAAEVGRRLAAIHAGTAGDEEIRRAFPTDDLFHAIRLEPYLEATAEVHADCAARLNDLVRVTASTKRALVHGDVSPKNIQIGPDGPVFLDAECAWYGDPAFDPAFCLNHLLLKCLWTPSAADRFIAAFRTLAETYLSGVEWEPRQDIEARIAHLLPGLMLARIDGKSPVEYVTEETDRNRVRKFARTFLLQPVDTLSAIADAWHAETSESTRA